MPTYFEPMTEDGMQILEELEDLAERVSAYTGHNVKARLTFWGDAFTLFDYTTMRILITGQPDELYDYAETMKNE